ncbi:autotransporter assembly complex protein TamA [Sphingomonas sp. RS2018]
MWGYRILLLAGVAGLSSAAAAQIATPQSGQNTPSRLPPPATPTPPARTASGSTAQSPSPTDPNAPIVPDAAFQKEIPALSDDVAAPLEPIEAFGSPPPAPVPPVAGQTAPAVVAQDGELTQPLTPLSNFDVTPVEVAGVDDTKAPEIRYDVRVDGLDAIGLTARFDDLSALKDDKEAPNAAVVAARAREDEQLAVRLMRSLGYYDATASSAIEQLPQTPGRVRAVVTAVPGALYTLGSVTVTAGPTVPPDLARRELALKVGDAIDAERVQAAEANVSLRLPQQGYAFATVGERDILLDETSFKGDYTLPIDVGPRGSFGRIVTKGDDVFGIDHLNVFPRYKEGELYDSRRVDDLREALVATSLFSSIGVEPQRTGRVNPDGTEAVDLLVTQNKGPARTLAATGGYGTGQGMRIEGSWTHRNLFAPEGALIAAGVAGTLEQALSATFRRSNAGRRDRTFSIIAAANHSNYDAFESFTGTLAAKISYDSTPIWQKPFTYAFGVELVGTNEDRFVPSLGRRERGTYFIGALPVQGMWDKTDDLLNPTRGFRVKANVSPETSIRAGIRPYARVLLEGTAYMPVSSSIVVAGRLRGGSIAGISRDDLAPSRRYYAGGGGSVRGFGYQELGPKSVEANPDFDPTDPDEEDAPTIVRPLGGRSVIEGAIEARYRFGNFGIVPFVDVGQVYDSVFPKGSDLRFGAGIGGRYYTNFGPFRIDVATPIGRRRGESLIAVYLGIGQAF